MIAGRMSHADGQSTHPSIDNTYGFPLPETGAVILEEEVVKEGHLVKNLKRRLFTLFIDSERFPCLSYWCLIPHPTIFLHSSHFASNSDPKSKADGKAEDISQEKGHVRLVSLY